MKIVHIITRMIIGGAQENTLFNCLDLATDFGDQVTLITGPTEGPEGKLLQRLSESQRSRINVETVPSLCREIHPWNDPNAYRQLKRLLHRLQPDVVHTHSAKAGILGRLAAWKRKVPAVVHTVHGAPFYEYQNRAAYWSYRWCEWYAAKHCHHLISVADAMTDLMVKANVASPDKFTTIYSGMDVQPYLNATQLRQESRQKLGFSPQDIVVGKIARLAPLKGHEYLLAAAPKLIQQNPNIRFLLVGNGSLTEQIQQQIRAAGLQDHFVLTGLVDPAEVPEMVAAMDLVVHTSLREGLARVLPQSLLAGLPVVSFDIDGAREVCISNETGWLIPAKDQLILTEKILDLANDPEKRQRMGRAGQLRFQEQFDHHFMTRRIREVYQQVLEGEKQA